MPRYEYTCNEGHTWAEHMPLSAWDKGWDGKSTCKECGTEHDQEYLDLRRIPDINPFGFRVANLEQENFGTNHQYNEYLKRNDLVEREPRFTK